MKNTHALLDKGTRLRCCIYVPGVEYYYICTIILLVYFICIKNKNMKVYVFYKIVILCFRFSFYKLDTHMVDTRTRKKEIKQLSTHLYLLRINFTHRHPLLPSFHIYVHNASSSNIVFVFFALTISQRNYFVFF